LAFFAKLFGMPDANLAGQVLAKNLDAQPGAPKETALPTPPTPAIQAQSAATAAAKAAATKQRRRSAAGTSGRVLPRGRRPAAGAAPGAIGAPMPRRLLGGMIS